MADLFKGFAEEMQERLEKAKQEQYYTPKGKRGIREERRIDVANTRPKPLQNRLKEYKERDMSKEEGFEDQIKANAEKKARQDAERKAKAQRLADKTKRGSRDYNYETKQIEKPGLQEAPKKEPVDRKGFTVVKNDLVEALMEKGFTQSARDLSIWDQKDLNAQNMEKALLKSGYGPKNMSQYNPGDNQKRKENNTGESLKDIGKNINTKKYTTSNASMQAANEKATEKEQKKKTKESTRTMSDFSPEELQAMVDKANKPK
jgi:hypothetical protein